MLRFQHIPASLISLILLAIPTQALFGLEWPSFGKQQRFVFEGLVNAGSLGLEHAQGMVSAVGDVEGNQMCVKINTGGDRASSEAARQIGPVCTKPRSAECTSLAVGQRYAISHASNALSQTP